MPRPPSTTTSRLRHLRAEAHRTRGRQGALDLAVAADLVLLGATLLAACVVSRLAPSSLRLPIVVVALFMGGYVIAVATAWARTRTRRSR